MGVMTAKEKETVAKRFLSWWIVPIVAHALCLLKAQTLAVTPVPSIGSESRPLVASELAKPLEPSAPVLRVTCEHDELAIIADGASLRNILSAVQGCTGIPMLMPEDMKNEKSYIHLGPSSTLSVLEGLLDSTELNFVIQPANSAKHRGITVMLIPRLRESRIAENTGLQESGSSAPTTAARRAWMATRVAGRSALPATDDTYAATEGSNVVTQEAPAQESPAARESNSESGVPSTEQGKQSGAASPVGDRVQGASAAASADPIVRPAVPDQAQPSSPDAVRARQIEDMQKLFEDRKKQMSTPVPATANPNTLG